MNEALEKDEGGKGTAGKGQENGRGTCRSGSHKFPIELRWRRAARYRCLGTGGIEFLPPLMLLILVPRLSQ